MRFLIKQTCLPESINKSVFRVSSFFITHFELFESQPKT